MNVGEVIEKITQTPTKKYTKEEAKQILRSCGILDSKNSIKLAYREIIKSEKQSESKDV